MTEPAVFFSNGLPATPTPADRAPTGALALGAQALRALGIQCSDQLDAFATAMAKAQADFKPVTKGSKNPHLGSTYADLAAFLEVAMPSLARNGIATLQPVSVHLRDDLASGTVRVTTLLLHSSGQWIGAATDFPALPMVRKGGAVDKQVSPQAVGSALTYGRRYGLTALISIAAAGDDDDGAASSDAPTARVSSTQGRPAEPLLAFGNKKGTPLSKLTDAEIAEALEFGERQVHEERAKAAPGAKLPSWVAKVTLNLAALHSEQRARAERGARTEDAA